MTVILNMSGGFTGVHTGSKVHPNYARVERGEDDSVNLSMLGVVYVSSLYRVTCRSGSNIAVHGGGRQCKLLYNLP